MRHPDAVTGQDHVREVISEIFCHNTGFETLVSKWGQFGLWNEACLDVAVFISGSRSETVSRENVPGGRSGRREEDQHEPDDDTMQMGDCHRRDSWS